MTEARDKIHLGIARERNEGDNEEQLLSTQLYENFLSENIKQFIRKL